MPAVPKPVGPTELELQMRDDAYRFVAEKRLGGQLSEITVNQLVRRLARLAERRRRPPDREQPGRVPADWPERAAALAGDRDAAEKRAVRASAGLKAAGGTRGRSGASAGRRGDSVAGAS